MNKKHCFVFIACFLFSSISLVGFTGGWNAREKKAFWPSLCISVERMDFYLTSIKPEAGITLGKLGCTIPRHNRFSLSAFTLALCDVVAPQRQTVLTCGGNTCNTNAEPGIKLQRRAVRIVSNASFRGLCILKHMARILLIDDVRIWSRKPVNVLWTSWTRQTWHGVTGTLLHCCVSTISDRPAVNHSLNSTRKKNWHHDGFTNNSFTVSDGNCLFLL